MIDTEKLEDILHREKLAEIDKEVYEGDTAPEWHKRVDNIIDEYIPANDYRGTVTEWAERRVRPSLELERIEFAIDLCDWQMNYLLWASLSPMALLITLVWWVNL